MGVSVREMDTNTGLFTCNCLFPRRYKLPCQHIFHIDRASIFSESTGEVGEERILSPRAWQHYLNRFRTGGTENCEGLNSGDMDGCALTKAPYPGTTARILKLGEVNERIRSTFYKLEEEDSKLSIQLLNDMERQLSASLTSRNGPSHQVRTGK